MRLPSPLSDEAEEAMSEAIGCAIAVHRVPGPGFLESIYKKAMHVELNARGISYESEKPVTVHRTPRRAAY
jgi:GxxExxY protein